MCIRAAALFGLSGLALLVLSGAASAWTSVGPAALNADTTWDLAGSPYYVEGTITVGANATLTVNPGVEVDFNGPYAIAVAGGLQVLGNSTATVVFDSNNTSLLPPWGGLQFFGTGLASAVLNASFHHSAVPLDVNFPTADLDVSNVSVADATVYGLRVLNSAVNLTVSDLSIVDSGDGAYLNNSSHVSISAFRTSNLLNALAYSLFAQRTTSCDFAALDFPGSRLRLYQSFFTNITGVRANATGFAFGVDLASSTVVNVTDVALKGYTNAAFSAVSVFGLTVNNITYGPLANTTAPRALVFSNSIRFALHHADLRAAPTAVDIFACPYFSADNVTASQDQVGISIGSSIQFALDNATVVNATGNGLAINSPGAGSVVKYLNIVNAANGINFTASEYNFDFSQGNVVNGRPVLGLYNTPYALINPAGTYGWVYVYNSHDSRATFLDIPYGSGSPSAVWANSSDGLIDGGTIRGRYYGLWVVNSDRMSLVSDTIIVNETVGLTISTSGSVTVRDTVATSLGSHGAALNTLNDSLVQNLTASGGGFGMIDFQGRSNTITASKFNGSTFYGLVVSNSVRDRIDSSSFCTASFSTSLGIINGTEVLATGNRFCKGVGGAVGQGVGNVIENSTFDGLTTAVSAGGGLIVRWNEFRNCTQYGVRILPGVALNLVFENNFFCGARSGSDASSFANLWYNATRRHGNYWDNYGGVDANGDRIGDTPYPVPDGTRSDLFPLVIPYDAVPPVAVPFAPYAVDEDKLAPLDGSNSTDNIAVAGGWWQVYDASGTSNVTGLNTTYTFATPGVYMVRLFVYDAWNNTANATTTVTVRDTTPPYFPAGIGPFTVDEDTDALLTVYVVDNDPAFPDGAVFDWLFTGRQNLSRTTYEAFAFVNISEPGSYVGTLVVTDGALNSVTGTFNVTVLDRTPPTYTFLATGAVPPAQGDTVRLEMRNARDNDLAFPGTNAFYWMVILPGGGFVEDFNQSWNFTVDSPGPYEVDYECRDPSGNVRRGNWTFDAADTQGPAWAPPQGLTVADGANATLSAKDATDYSGVVDASWREGAVLLSSNLSFERTWRGLGNHSINVVLTDTLGNVATYTFNLLVFDATPPTLVNASFRASATVKQQASFEREASGEFSDNDPSFASTVRYLWSTDAANVTWGSPLDASRAILLFNATGTFHLTVRVFDSAGNFVDESIQVTVIDGAPPSGIVWSVSPNFTVALGTTVVFNASAQDPSGVFFHWQFGDGSGDDGPSVQYEYVAVGVYHVVLLVDDGAGNEATVRFTVNVVASLPGGGGGSGGGGGGGGGGGSGAGGGFSTTTLILIALAAVGAGIAVMFLAFRRKLKGPPPQPIVIQEEAPRYEYGPQPPSGGDLYGSGGAYDPYGGYQPPSRPPRPPVE